MSERDEARTPADWVEDPDFPIETFPVLDPYAEAEHHGYRTEIEQVNGPTFYGAILTVSYLGAVVWKHEAAGLPQVATRRCTAALAEWLEARS